MRKREERYTLRMTRSLLPLLHQHIRKDDLLSIHGSDMLVMVLNAEKGAAGLIAMRLKQAIESQRVSLGKRLTASPQVRYHVVSFAEDN